MTSRQIPISYFSASLSQVVLPLPGSSVSYPCLACKCACQPGRQCYKMIHSDVKSQSTQRAVLQLLCEVACYPGLGTPCKRCMRRLHCNFFKSPLMRSRAGAKSRAVYRAAPELKSLDVSCMGDLGKLAPMQASASVEPCWCLPSCHCSDLGWCACHCRMIVVSGRNSDR